MPLNCTVTPQGCFDCPEMPAVAASTGRVDVTARIGWDAGANSVLALAGDLHTVFTVPALVAGVMIGLRSERVFQHDPVRQPYALYFRIVGGRDFVSAYRFGEQVSSPVRRTADDVFEIRRVREIVTFWRGRTLLYQSPFRSTERLVVTANLYASGDGVA